MQVKALLDAFCQVFTEKVNTIRGDIGPKLKPWNSDTVRRNMGTLTRALPWLMYHQNCSLNQVDLTKIVDTNVGMLYASFLRQKKKGDYQEVRRTFQQFHFLCGYFGATSALSGVSKHEAKAAQGVYQTVMSQMTPLVTASRQQRKEEATANQPGAGELATMVTVWQASIVEQARAKAEQELLQQACLTFDTAKSLRDALMLCVLINYGAMVSRPSFIYTPKTSKYAQQPCTHDNCARGHTCTGNYFKFDGADVVLVLSHHKNEHRTHDRLEIKFTDPAFVWMLGAWEQYGRASFLNNARCLVGQDIGDGDDGGEGVLATGTEEQPPSKCWVGACLVLSHDL